MGLFDALNLDYIVSIKIKVWISRASYFIALLIIVYIYVRNKLNRIAYSSVSNNHQNKNHSTSKWLYRWSFCVFLSCYISLIVFITTVTPYICLYTRYFYAAAISFPHVFLTYFQISRLQYTFSGDNSKSMGYPSFLFKILRLIGIPILLYNMVQGFFTYQIYEFDDFLGCGVQHRSFFFESLVLFYAAYLIWDWAVVSLYIHKLYTIKQEITKSDKNGNILR